MSQIVFDRVVKRYEGATEAALEEVSFEVPAGQLATMLGPSGCGKTTLLRLIAGLESPSAGRILIGGRDVTTLGPAERNVSMMFQSYALFPHMSVLENVAYGLLMSKVERGAARERASAALAGVGLEGLEARAPGELSGGQQQRVALARALVLEPDVLLFDEPLSNLDARLRREMRDEIRALQQRLGLTVAYVTHDQAEAMAVSDLVVVMQRGRIAQVGTPREIYERPCSAFVAGFMGEAALFDAQADGRGHIRLGPLEFAAPGPVAPGPVRLAVRPEAWSIRAGGAGLPARVARSAYVGAAWEVTFDTALGTVFAMARDPGLPLAPGQEAVLVLDARGAALLPP